jgi:AhpD family alkylhydroperoxidase
MGLVASLVLRCDDCVSYHIARAVETGASRTEIMETMSIGLVVGGSIVIPHLRRAVAFLDDMQSEA